MSDTAAPPAPLVLTADQKRTLAAVRKRLGCADIVDIVAGMELLVPLADPVLWASVAAGARWENGVVFDDDAEIPKRVKKDFREQAALYALRHTGKLDGIPSLTLPPTMPHLGPLAGLAALRELTVTTRDVSPLAGLALERLTITAAGEGLDLSPLAAVPSLQALTLDAVGTSLAPLAGLPHLANVTLLKPADLAPLTGCPELRALACAGEVNLAPLPACAALRELDLRRIDPRRVDLAPLARCEHLTTIQLPAWPADGAELAPLADLPDTVSIHFAAASSLLSGLPLDIAATGRALLRHVQSVRRPLATNTEASHAAAVERAVTVADPRIWTCFGDFGLAVEGATPPAYRGQPSPGLPTVTRGSVLKTGAAVLALRRRGALDGVETLRVNRDRMEWSECPDLAALDGHPHLRHLRVGLTKLAFPRFPRLPALETLQLGRDKEYWEKLAPGGDADLACLEVLPQLRSLDVNAEQTAIAGLPQLPALEELTIRCERLVLDELPALRALTIDASISVLPRLPALETLHLRGTTLPTLDALAGAPHLHTVDLEVRVETIPHLPALRTLHAAKGFTDLGAAPSLEVLGVKGEQIGSLRGLTVSRNVRTVTLDAPVTEPAGLWEVGADGGAAISSVTTLYVHLTTLRPRAGAPLDLRVLLPARKLEHLTIVGVDATVDLGPLCALPALREVVLKRGDTWDGAIWTAAQFAPLGDARFVLDVQSVGLPEVADTFAPAGLRVRAGSVLADLEPIARLQQLTCLDVEFHGRVVRLPGRRLRELTIRALGRSPDIDTPSVIEVLRMDGAEDIPNFRDRVNVRTLGVRGEALANDAGKREPTLRGYVALETLEILDGGEAPGARGADLFPAALRTVRLCHPRDDLMNLAWIPTHVTRIDALDVASLAGAEALTQLETLVVGSEGAGLDLTQLRPLVRLRALDLSACVTLPGFGPLAHLPALAELRVHANVDPSAVEAVLSVTAHAREGSVQVYTLAPRAVAAKPAARMVLTLEGCGAPYVDGVLVDTPVHGNDLTLELAPGSHTLEMKTTLGTSIARGRFELTEGADLRITFSSSGTSRLRTGNQALAEPN